MDIYQSSVQILEWRPTTEVASEYKARGQKHTRLATHANMPCTQNANKMPPWMRENGIKVCFQQQGTWHAQGNPTSSQAVPIRQSELQWYCQGNALHPNVAKSLQNY